MQPTYQPNAKLDLSFTRVVNVTDRKFNRMRPSMARVLGFWASKHVRHKQFERSLAAQWQELGRQYAFGSGAHAATHRSD